MSEEKLGNIQNLLEDIKEIFLLANHDKIEEAKKKLLTPNSIEETVYKLCDGVNTTIEIAKIIEKDNFPKIVESMASSKNPITLIKPVANPRSLSLIFSSASGTK